MKEIEVTRCEDCKFYYETESRGTKSCTIGGCPEDRAGEDDMGRWEVIELVPPDCPLKLQSITVKLKES